MVLRHCFTPFFFFFLQCFFVTLFIGKTWSGSLENIFGPGDLNFWKDSPRALTLSLYSIRRDCLCHFRRQSVWPALTISYEIHSNPVILCPLQVQYGLVLLNFYIFRYIACEFVVFCPEWPGTFLFTVSFPFCQSSAVTWREPANSRASQ